MSCHYYSRHCIRHYNRHYNRRYSFHYSKAFSRPVRFPYMPSIALLRFRRTLCIDNADYKGTYSELCIQDPDNRGRLLCLCRSMTGTVHTLYATSVSVNVSVNASDANDPMNL